MNRKAITLIVLVMIIALLGIIVAGIMSYTAEGLFFVTSNVNNEKAFYMAQAGIMRAIADFHNSGNVSWNYVTTQNVPAGSEFFYRVGEAANFFLVDASNSMLGGSTLQGIPIKNINSANSITITSMIMEWSFGGNITGITLGGSSVWSGTAASGASLNITDFTLTAGQSFSADANQAFQFSNAISGNIIATFIFSDGSQYRAYLLKNSLCAARAFSIKATGEVKAGTRLEARRTLAAVYDSGTNNFISWEESQNHLP